MLNRTEKHYNKKQSKTQHETPVVETTKPPDHSNVKCRELATNLPGPGPGE